MPLLASVSVRSYELDSFGHVNNAVYLNYLEEARSEYLKQIGLSFNDFERLNIHLVITEVHIRYISSARYGEQIQITGTFSKVGGASLTIEYVLTEVISGRLLATAETRGAFIDPATGRPVRAPEAFRKGFQTGGSG